MTECMCYMYPFLSELPVKIYKYSMGSIAASQHKDPGFESQVEWSKSSLCEVLRE